MMKRTRAAAIAGATAIVLAVAACGSGGSSAAPATTPAGGSGSASAAPAGGGGVVSFDFYYPVGVSGPLATIMKNLVGQFNAGHPKIKVDPVFAGSYLQTLQKLQVAIQGGQPPAVAVVNHVAAFDLVHQNAVEPLDDIAKAGNFYPQLLEPEIAGHTWGIPFQRSTEVMYYNKDAFTKAGLDPNKPPDTWTELVADAQALQKAGYTGIEVPIGGATGSEYWAFQPYAIEAGQNLVGNDGVTTYFNSPAVVTALQFVYDLSHKYHVEPTGLLPWNDVPSDFESGKVGIITHSSGSLAAILKAAKFDVGVAFMPKDVGAKRTVLGGGDLYLISKASAAQKAAGKTFIEWMTAPAQQASWTTQTGYVPVSPDDLTNALWTKYVADHPQAKVAVEQLPDADIEMSTYQLSQVTNMVNAALDAGLNGSQTPKAALDGLQSAVQQVLAPYRK